MDQKLPWKEKKIILELSLFLTSRFHLILSILNYLLVKLFLLEVVEVPGVIEQSDGAICI